ncbi:MAG: DNA-directed RNA polymerase subunit omega [Bryobacteraceae bacterium]|nr:DNA-directed RNA polymerase subunit omega [Bryobacteraceae bacterium]MCZ2080589.1 DNA-directed RNA polymerase subunit omega [Bryobacterales bacterium]MEB2361837.1 DNA-directed RNA polymerase subunit omega [Bryobacterales bacterium]NUN00956.1 DNA-directed RNA polymerase subunit omega [Bryobacteraceae bacterium]HEU0138362.1 DNA-directed RNA polymerase subunit omega [Bryobacteraceae bacterium]
MPEKLTRNQSIHSIPDDTEQSAYRFIILSAKRARQLQNGARSFLPTTSRKPTITAMEEVRRGLVKYSDTGRDAELNPVAEES